MDKVSLVVISDTLGSSTISSITQLLRINMYEGVETASDQAELMITCRFYLLASAVSSVSLVDISSSFCPFDAAVCRRYGTS
jgi:hypothetical protein